MSEPTVEAALREALQQIARSYSEDDLAWALAMEALDKTEAAAPGDVPGFSAASQAESGQLPQPGSAALRSRGSTDTEAAPRLRDKLVQAVNGNPISAEDAWAILHEWDVPLRGERGSSDTCDDCAALNVAPCPHVRGSSDTRLVGEEARKVAAYDAARAVVKTEGNSRAYYVLRAEAAEAELTQAHANIDLLLAQAKREEGSDTRLTEALRDLLDNGGWGHGHWRDGGVGGSCSTCEQQQQACARARAALAAARADAEQEQT